MDLNIKPQGDGAFGANMMPGSAYVCKVCGDKARQDEAKFAEESARQAAARVAEDAAHAALPVMTHGDWLDFLQSKEPFIRMGITGKYVYHGKRPEQLTVPQVMLLFKDANLPTQRIHNGFRSFLGITTNKYTRGWVVGNGSHRRLFRDSWVEDQAWYVLLVSGELVGASKYRKGGLAVWPAVSRSWKPNVDGMTSAREWVRRQAPY